MKTLYIKIFPCVLYHFHKCTWLGSFFSYSDLGMDRLTNSSGTNLDARSAGPSPNRMDAVSHPDSRDAQSAAVHGA